MDRCASDAASAYAATSAGEHTTCRANDAADAYAASGCPAGPAHAANDATSDATTHATRSPPTHIPSFPARNAASHAPTDAAANGSGNDAHPATADAAYATHGSSPTSPTGAANHRASHAPDSSAAACAADATAWITNLSAALDAAAHGSTAIVPTNAARDCWDAGRLSWL